MLPYLSDFRKSIHMVINDKTEQGHVTTGLTEKLTAIPDSYDRLYEFARTLADLPFREDWPYLEPNDWDGITAEMAPDRPQGVMGNLVSSETAGRIETAFLSSVCGCVLGKPIEINPTLEEIRTASEAIGEWPVRDYISIKINMRGHRVFHPSYRETTREDLRFAAPDDDVNYTVMGMLLLEDHGLEFTHDQMRRKWLSNIPPYFSWGPERTMVLVGGLRSLDEYKKQDDAWYREIVTILNPGDELCGAMIRADAYGYASPGNPAQAAWLAWKDASFTHRRTGIYGTMFAAAAMAVAPVAKSPLEIFEVAMKFIPQRSRLYKIVSDSLNMVAEASDWLDGYHRIHGKYKEYAHCRIHQESGTLINSLKFAENIGDGICKQVMQGNDTDSYGATCGSILGLYFGPGHLEERWLTPLNDTVHTSLADFHEQCLSRLAQRMGRLPESVNKS